MQQSVCEENVWYWGIQEILNLTPRKKYRERLRVKDCGWCLTSEAVLTRWTRTAENNEPQYVLYIKEYQGDQRGEVTHKMRQMNTQI
jgi:hypothetical protein